MKLDYVVLVQFGGHVGLRVDFGDGLTVVAGPNDAGKSTLYHAVFHALLTGTNLNKRAFERDIAPFVPFDGGDHAAVELGFSVAGQPYVVEKTWSEKKALRRALLRQPSGTEVRDDDGIAAFIESHLPASPATVGTVLMSYQAGLSESLEELEQSETLENLEDILRRTVMQAGGVSVSRFRERVAAELSSLGGRWDFDAEGPERGRDFRDPWDKGAGSLVKAFYTLEELTSRLTSVRATEDALDAFNRRLADLETELRGAQAWLDANQDLFESLDTRGRIEAELQACTERGALARSIYDGWTRAERDLTEARAKIPIFAARRVQLADTVASLESATEHAAQRQRLDAATGHDARCRALQREIAGIPAVTTDILAQLEELDGDLRELRALNRGTLALTFHAHRDQQLRLTCDLEDPTEKTLFANRDLAIDANGRITLEHSDWSLTVTAGEGDFAAQKARFEAATEGWNERLTTLGVADLKSARAAAGNYSEATARLARAQEDLSRALGEETLESLQTRVAALPPARDLGDPQAVYREHADTVAELNRLRSDLDRHESQIARWRESYAEPDLALEALAEARALQKRAQVELDAVPALPTGSTPEAFGAEYRRRRSEISEMRDARGELREKRAALASNLGDESTLELTRRVAAARRVYERLLARGHALRRVQAAAETILNRPSGDIYADMRTRVEELVARLSGARYGAATMDQALPEAFTREDGVAVPVSRLSQGMRDIVGLSVRLAIARHLLNGAGGFFVMDDPLVNLDPGRQAEAVAVLRDVAAERQVVVFTCHDRHAEMLGGHRVRL